MRFTAIATDYDGTLAYRGIVDDETIAALRRAREAGRRLLLVTGRDLTGLFNTFQHSRLFDAIVAENGAVLYVPATQEVRVIAEVPPPALVERLTKEKFQYRSAIRSSRRWNRTNIRYSLRFTTSASSGT